MLPTRHRRKQYRRLLDKHIVSTRWTLPLWQIQWSCLPSLAHTPMCTRHWTRPLTNRMLPCCVRE
jgi:hypothetical protein